MEIRMNERVSAFKTWIKIELSHAYFQTKKCGFDIVPDEKTLDLLKKAGILIKKRDACTWLLIKHNDEEDERLKLFLEAIDFPALSFHIKNQSAESYYYTEPETIYADSYEHKYIGKNGIFFELTVPVDKKIINKGLNVNLQLKSKYKYWEFIMIPKFSPENVRIKLQESKGKIDFDPKGKINFPGEGKEIFRFVSKEPIELKEKYDYIIRLWEEKDKWDYLLIDALAFPRIYSISIFDKADTITTYCYF